MYDGLDHELTNKQLAAPQNTPVPEEDSSFERLVYVCPGIDLFDKVLDEAWVQQVLEAIDDNPEWRFLIVTESPYRIAKLNLPDNCWCGIRITTQKSLESALQVFSSLSDERIRCLLFDSLDSKLRRRTLGQHAVFSDVNWVIFSHKPVNVEEEENPEEIFMAARESGCPVYFASGVSLRPQEHPIEMSLLSLGRDEEDEDYDED